MRAERRVGNGGRDCGSAVAEERWSAIRTQAVAGEISPLRSQPCLGRFYINPVEKQKFIECALVNNCKRVQAPETRSRILCFDGMQAARDRKSTRLNSSHTVTSYAVFCLKKKTTS